MNKFQRTSLLLALMMLLSLTALPVLSLAEVTSASVTEAADATQEKKQLNPFVAMEILDIHEHPFDTSIFNGKPFMLNIWGAWCPPCVREMPDLSELYDIYKDRITIVGLAGTAVTGFNEDGTGQYNQKELQDVRDLYESKQIRHPSLLPNPLMAVLMNQINMQSWPTTVFVNGEGVLVNMVVGSKTRDQWITIIDQVLAAMEADKAPAEGT
jgi:cytochrome c-type biogenesis protein